MAAAASTTKGVYILEKRVIKRSIFGLLAAAFSTESKILVTIECSNVFSTWIFNCPAVLMQPEVTASPGLAFTGTGSPVIGEVSKRLSPSIMMPSKGIRSPGRTIRISPHCASSAGSSFVESPVTKLTVSGRRSTASMI